MAESGAAAGNSISEILQNWASIGNIFVAFIIAGLVPILRHFGSRYNKWKAIKEAKELEEEKTAITEIAKEVQQPLTTRITKMEETLDKQADQNEKLIEHMNIIQQLLQTGRVTFHDRADEYQNNSSKRKPGRPSKHFDNATGSGNHSGYDPR